MNPSESPIPTSETSTKKVEPQEVLAQMRARRMGHWKDLNLPENEIAKVDRNQLSEDLNRVGQAEHALPEEAPISYWRKDLTSLTSSFFLHLILLVLLLFQFAIPAGDGLLQVSGSRSSAIDLETPFEDSSNQNSEFIVANDQKSQIDAEDLTAESNPQEAFSEIEVTAVSDLGTIAPGGTNQSIVARNPSGGSLAGRNDPKLRQPNKKFGPSKKTELAVEKGLRWIYNHQLDDGSWSFVNPDGCTCDKEGASCRLKTAATGLALLAFLGHGDTHLKASNEDYRKSVAKGLGYLISVIDRNEGDLTRTHNKGMYAQGIATLAICEAYAMTRDERLQPYAQQAVKFICDAQDKKGGGWRYQPEQPGDITITGWQLMALKTAKLSDTIKVPDAVLQRARKFVESQAVSGTGGFTYPDKPRNKPLPGPTAIGILLRMYNGWELQEDVIQRGIGLVEQKGFDVDDMYVNYYATQVMFHHGGPEWEGWNMRMKSFFLSSQVTGGHADGSWNFPDCPHTAEGGRLYNTALAVMMLEVYYRHLKLYHRDALIANFPLEDD